MLELEVCRVRFARVSCPRLRFVEVKGLYMVMYTGSQSKAFERGAMSVMRAPPTDRKHATTTTARLATPHTARLKPAGH